MMKSPFTVIATGQSLITRDIRDVRDEGFANVLNFLQRGDVVFTNFESTILGRHGGWPTKGKYFGYSRAEVLDALKAIGFNALALANNHAFDLGPYGILSTLEEVRSRGFLHAGIGINETNAARPGRRHIGGRNVALLAVDAGPGPANMYAEDGTSFRPARPGVNRLRTLRKIGATADYFRKLASLTNELRSSHLELANYAQPEEPPLLSNDKEINFYGTVLTQAIDCGRLVEVDPQSENTHLCAIRRARERGDFVITYLHHHHWEPDWQEIPNWVKLFARRCVDAGAGLFVSHGAPVLQGVEIYKGSPIFYGLGNFIFHTDPHENEWNPPEVWESIVAACCYDASGSLETIDLLPVVIGAQSQPSSTASRLVPVAATGNAARRILNEFASRSKALGTEVEISQCGGCITAEDATHISSSES
jgi:poly-gamma-glutamate synthesis protein (capsule biosynthesis protein)